MSMTGMVGMWRIGEPPFGLDVGEAPRNPPQHAANCWLNTPPEHPPIRSFIAHFFEYTVIFSLSSPSHGP